MISVPIAINGSPIYTRTAINRGEVSNGLTKYELDDGSTILHRRSDGAVTLAIRMMAEIREQDIENRRIAAAKDRALKTWSKAAQRKEGE